ncbi:type II secretion system F family protein [Ammoniphilus resinae]|uniref:Type IV pilus assembly protein PilC n=1 Tax=Ammoniphilus resinae TaxID=861532 RepID=A0ABS4GIY8_9BACL|nr:type II secretion system F family protein [Ammoniphilus resinae]MBP1930223.1 type IV pilus assembly protein PilC [Ammoniphilus resinae]
MAVFRFEGRDRTGRVRKGNQNGASRREVILKLREKGIAVNQIWELEDNLLYKEITIGNPVKFQELVIFIRQFSTLLEAGVTVVDATRVLANQTENKTFRRVLETIEEDLRSGKLLSEATAKHPKVFPTMFINMVEAGEIGGNLDDTLERLAVYFERQHRTRQKVVSALAYPITVGIVAICVVAFLLTSVVPTFANMFQGFGAELPAITKFVLGASEWMQGNWWIFILLGISLYVGFFLVKKNKNSKYYLDYFTLKLPIFGKLVQKAILARMARTLSSLFSSSVPILQAITIVEKVVGNEVLGQVLTVSRSSLEKGESLTEPMKGHWIFPPLVTQMITIGEQTGTLDLMLAKVADFYEAEVEAATDRIKSLIEPFMIIILAGVVGTIVTSILVPMFEIFNHVGQ